VEANDRCVAARDSFAYTARPPQPVLRAVLVTNPTQPIQVAACSTFNFPADLVLNGSFLYYATDNRFQVIDVARPRQPRVVGMCALPGRTSAMNVSETLAYVANGIAGLQIIDVARPAAPAVVGELALPNGAIGVALADTFAYVTSNNLYIVSIAEPTSPYLIDSVVLPKFGWSAATGDSFLFVGSWDGASGDIRLFDIRNPADPVSVGSLVAPDGVRRLAWVGPHLFAACGDAGVLVVETTAAGGVAEPRARVRSVLGIDIAPNPAGDWAMVRAPALSGGGSLRLYDVSGREVLRAAVDRQALCLKLNLADLGAGLYLVRLNGGSGVLKGKLVKR